MTFIIMGLMATAVYTASCEAKDCLSRILRYLSFAFPLLCLPFHFSLQSLCFCVLVTAGELSLDKNMIGTGVATFLYGYAVLCCHYVNLPFNVIYKLVCFAVTTFVMFQKDVLVMVAAYIICVIIPLIICVLINYSAVCALLLLGDVLLGVNYLKHNRLVMYASQLCFYVGSCMAVGLL